MKQVTHVAFNPVQEMKTISFVVKGYHYSVLLIQLKNGKWVFNDSIIHEGLEKEYCPYCNKEKEEMDMFETPCLSLKNNKSLSKSIFVELKEHPLLSIKLLTNGIIFDETLIKSQESTKEERMQRLYGLAQKRNEEIVAFLPTYDAYCPIDGVTFPLAETEKELLRFSCPYKVEQHSLFEIWINEKEEIKNKAISKKQTSTDQYGIKKDIFRKKANENKEKAIKLVFHKEKTKAKKSKHCIAGVYFIHWCIEKDFTNESFKKFVKSSDPDEIKETKWYLFNEYKENFHLFSRDWVTKEERKEYMNYCKKKQKVKA